MKIEFLKKFNTNKDKYFSTGGFCWALREFAESRGYPVILNEKKYFIELYEFQPIYSRIKNWILGTYNWWDYTEKGNTHRHKVVNILLGEYYAKIQLKEISLDNE